MGAAGPAFSRPAGGWAGALRRPVGDVSQETFWRQLLRWTVGGTPGRVVVSSPRTQLQDDGKIQFRAEVRNLQYLPAGDADVEAKIISPDGGSESVALRPEALAPGIFSAEWNAPKN